MFGILNFRKILLVLGDITLLYLALLGMVFFGFWGAFSWELFLKHLLPFSLLYFIWLIIFYIFGLYDLNLIRSEINFYPKIVGALFTSLIAGLVFFYLVPFFEITPKTNLLINVLIFGILFLGWRKFFYFLFSAHFQKTVTILGESSQIEQLSQEINQRPHLGYKLINLDSNQDLLSQIQENKIDALIIPTDLGANSWLTESLYRCLPARINFMDWAKTYEMVCNKIPVSLITQTWFLENLQEGEKILYDNLKRVIDIILASSLLIISLPFWLLIALAIKLEDKGPIFYKQKRVGKDRRAFWLLKFRSMKVDAEDKTGPLWAEKEDPRRTKVGKFLRKLHLDELPQMINVLKGDISLVGPRPERPEFVAQLEKEIPHYHLRHLIKPGFTGWAQIKFRYSRTVMDSQEKFQYDLYYLKNRSLFLDLGILLKTFQLFFKKE